MLSGGVEEDTLGEEEGVRGDEDGKTGVLALLGEFLG